MDGANKAQKKKKWFLPLVFSLLTSTLLITLSLSTSSYPFRHTPIKKPQAQLFVESKLHVSPTQANPIPRLAYLISGSKGDCESLKRTLKALYHPLNQYVVHLDLEASAEERLELVNFVKNEELFVRIGNVRVVVRSNLVTYRGPTMVSNTLHAAAILLKQGGEWDWFINLSASDYPLVTQDDMLHTLSTIPRNLNFIEHTSDIGWKEVQRAKPVIIDPGLYSLHKSDVFWVSEKRSVPTAYKLFTGYFHTVICNAEEFQNTTVNHDLHFISWDNPPKQHPHFLTLDDYQRMVDSNAPFARKFGRNEAALDKIDSELLGRVGNGFVPGSWFDKGETNTTAPHYTIANITELRPGPGAERINKLITGLLSDKDFHAKHCI
ncbi:Beta-glucuronosyltransferase [Actinidia chinensis var. chinensis]|uniref:Beta-glucuronosyltransferase n=1 Tax=Actinidia chinensis var. chinensis TaxID=1590841 RepID=A0A2R6P2L6_ACTCC|nr:Beta-glucuronosyltransferase [Actinidia chinensis var. chinensis]